MDHIRFYCGLDNRTWNGHPADAGPLVCISPIYGRDRRVTNIVVPPSTAVLQDSGAFCDSVLTGGNDGRLTFEAALARQEKHAERYGYGDKIAYRSSYDILIDETWSVRDGVAIRQKSRWSESDAREAADITVSAARFLNEHRNGYNLALNVQGVTARQYLACAKQIVPMLRDGDVLGFGGWCILGKKHGLLLPVFLETLAVTLPFIAHEGVSRIHIYGCIYTPALAAVLAMCDLYNISLSVDSAYPNYAPAFGNFGYGSRRSSDSYVRPNMLASCSSGSCAPDTHCRGLERIRHVRLTREWLSQFRHREGGVYEMYAGGITKYHTGRVPDPKASPYTALVLPGFA